MIRIGTLNNQNYLPRFDYLEASGFSASYIAYYVPVALDADITVINYNFISGSSLALYVDTAFNYSEGARLYAIIKNSSLNQFYLGRQNNNQDKGTSLEDSFQPIATGTTRCVLWVYDAATRVWCGQFSTNAYGT